MSSGKKTFTYPDMEVQDKQDIKGVAPKLRQATMAKRFARMAYALSDIVVGPNIPAIQNECNEAKRKLVTDFIRSATPEEIIKAASRINSTMNR